MQELDSKRFRKLLSAYPAKAIQFLYEYYYNDLVAYSETLTHDRKASEDVLQESLFDIWTKHERLGTRQEKSVVFYLMKIVRNKSISFYRKEKRASGWRVRFGLDHKMHGAEQTEEDRLIAGEIMQHIRKLIASFPRREQECYLLSRDEELTNRQIAEQLMISEKSVERSITSARKRIRKYLTDSSWRIDQR